MKNKQAIVKHNITDPSSRRTYKRHLRQNTRPFSLLITLLLFSQLPSVVLNFLLKTPSLFNLTNLSQPGILTKYAIV